MAKKSPLPPPPVEEDDLDPAAEEEGDGTEQITVTENLARREEILPKAGERSVPEIRASEAIRGMETEILSENIGIHPYTDWYITVHRTGPRAWMGRNVEERKVMDIGTGVRWPDLLRNIEDSNGGGTFAVRFFDSHGASVRMKTVKLPSTPKWTRDAYPEFAPPEDDVNADPELKKAENDLRKMDIHDQIDERKNRQEERQLNLMAKKAEVGAGGNLQQMLAMFAEERRLAAEREERRAAEAAARQEKHDLEVKELQTQQMQLMEKLTSGGNSSMGAVIAAITQSNNMMMQMQMESSKIQREIASEATRAQQDQSNRNMELMLRMTEMRQGNGSNDDMFIKLLELQGSERANSFQIATDIVKTMLPMLQGGNEDPDKPVAVQVIEAAGHVAEKFGGMINGAIKLRELGKPPQIKRPGAPGAQAPPKPNGPAPKAGGEAAPKTEEAPPAQLTPEIIRAEYPAAAINEKIRFMVSALLMEIDATPDPSKAFWIELVSHSATPDAMVGTILERGADDAGLKGLVLDLVRQHEPEALPQIEPVLSTPSAHAWLGQCYDYLEDKFADEEEDDTPETPA